MQKGDYAITITGRGDFTGQWTKYFSVRYMDEGTALTSSTAAWTAGIYYLTGDVTISDRITVTGNVTLVLNDGYTLNVPKGIDLFEGNELTIYGEANNSGTLNAGYNIPLKIDNELIYVAGIGSNKTNNYGTLTINGGTVIVKGGTAGAGIGGVYAITYGSSGGGTITINGGIVNATGANLAPGIGGGSKCGDIVINGGQLTATGGRSSVGIGPAVAQSGSGSLTIGWTQPSDFVSVTGDSNMYGFSSNFSSITLTNGFKIESTGETATADNIKEKESVKLVPNYIALQDESDNAATIAFILNDGATHDVVLEGRTLYKNGDWNTLCLPFDVTLAGSPLEGATVKELNASVSGLDADGLLTLNFQNAASIEAGKPYLVKWDFGTDIANPVFRGVTVTESTPTAVGFSNALGDDCQFVGQFSPFTIDDENKDEVIMISTGNRLGYSNVARTLRSFRCHFLVPTAPAAEARAMSRFVINFGNDGTTGIVTVPDASPKGKGSIYTIEGMRISESAMQKGHLYIINPTMTQNLALHG